MFIYAGAYYQTGPAPTTVIVNPSPMSGTMSMFPREPLQTTCPNCHQSVLTQISYEMGAMVWMLAIMLLVLGFVFTASYFHGVAILPTNPATVK